MKIRKFKFHCLHQSCTLKINPYTREDILGDYNKQNSRTNCLHPSGNDVEQEIKKNPN